jgi:hypothetical protein
MGHTAEEIRSDHRGPGDPRTERRGATVGNKEHGATRQLEASLVPVYQNHATMSVGGRWVPLVEGGPSRGKHSSSACRRGRLLSSAVALNRTERSFGYTEERKVDANVRASACTATQAFTQPPSLTTTGVCIETEADSSLEHVHPLRSAKPHANAQETGITSTEYAGSQQTVTGDEGGREPAAIRPTSPPAATGNGWRPEAVWLPTDDGPVNILLYIPAEYRATQVLLAKRSAWSDISLESKKAVVQCVRSACESAGFQISYPYARSISFMCATRNRILQEYRRRKKNVASNTEGEIQQDAPSPPYEVCKFQFSLSWLPTLDRWAFKVGYGCGSHNSETCRTEMNDRRLPGIGTAITTNPSSWEPAELLLPSENGPLNMVDYMGFGRRTAIIRLERQLEFDGNGVDCKRALVQLVRSACLSGGFEVHCSSLKTGDRVSFRCRGLLMSSAGLSRGAKDTVFT